MTAEKRKNIFIAVLCIFILHFFSMDSYASSSIATGVFMLSAGGSGGSASAPSGTTAGGGSITAISSVAPNLFSGVMSYSIPIDVPKGRKGMDPGLALTYSSSDGNGWVGVGWDLEVGAIERSARFGVVFNGDDYILRKAGSAIELIVDTNVGGLYHAKIEGEFNRIKKLAASDGRIYWEVTDKTGVRFLYGQTAASRQDDPANADNIFKWCLDQVVDTNGNYMTISYFKDQGQIYPDRIDYTGNVDGTPTTNYVKFFWESRTDAPDIYTTNFKVTTAYRLKTIYMVANGNKIRAYKLVYDTDFTTSGSQYSAGTGRSLLTSVQQYGSDVTLDSDTSGTVTGGSALPPMTFGWQAGGTWWSDHSWAGPAIAFAVSGQCFTGDLNGDGKTDFWCETASGSGTWSVAISTGSSWTTSQWSGPAPGFPVSDQCLMGDLNGDGKTDFWCETASGSGTWNVAISTGSGWTVTQWSGPTSAWPLYNQCLEGDLNGDGKTDFWCETASGSGLWNVALSTGSGWTVTQWSGPAPGFPVSDQCLMGDLNGDGKTDFWCETASGSGIWNTAISTGSSWATSQWSGPVTTSPVGDHCLSGDLNGDGKTDFWCETASGSGGWRLALSTGNSWTITPYNCGYGSTGAPVRSQCFTGDLNGDGKTDYWCESASGSGTWGVEQAIGNSIPDLLVSIQNGLGSTTTIAYTPSTQYANSQLPFPIQTVSSVITCDNYDTPTSTCKGTSSITSYTYSGGFFSSGERDFRGFNYVKVTGPSGPNGEQKTSETWYHQGNDTLVDVNDPNGSVGYMKGRPYRTRVSDASGAIYTETTTSYAPNADNTVPYYFNPPLQVDTFVCDGKAVGKCEGDASAKHLKIGYTFDQSNGNLREEDQYGDVSDSTDDRTIIKSYSLNTTDWILGLPMSEATYAGIGATGNLTASTTFYYDGAADCNTASTNQTPTKGNPTRIVRWLNGGTNPEVRMAYDTRYGNLVCTRDANGNISAITYDSTSTFQKVKTNALGHQTVTQYYGVDSVQTDNGHYGQVKSVTDPNQAVSTMVYDALGRKLYATAPDGCSTTWSYNNFGTVGLQNVQTTTCANISSWTYFDGLGRTTISKTQGGPNGRITSVNTEYNGTGTIKRTSMPYFDTAALWKTFTYDSMGRVTQATNPDGTSVQSCYNNGITIYINPKKQLKRETRNVQGQLIKIDEYYGTYTGQCRTYFDAPPTPYATTQYQYDLLGNLRFVTDAEGNQSEMRYDTLSRKTFMHDPDMGNWTYAYDANGNLTSQTDAKANTVTFTYDALNRVTRKHYPSGTDVVYAYDETSSTYSIGRLTKMADASGMTQYSYDILGRTTRVVKTVDGTAYPTDTTYDSAGRISTITYPGTAREVVTYSYDQDRNPWKVSGGGIDYATYTGYNALGQPQTITYGNGVSTTYQYHPTNSRLTSILTNSPASSLLNLTYTYDDNGNISGIADGIDSTKSQTYIYDDINRLIQAQSNSYGALFYAYNQTGNILNKEGVSYTYSSIGAGPHAVTSTSDGKTYTYDANGNMTNDSQRTIAYDYDNMPQSITINNSTTSFVYDGAGARVKKISSGGGSVYIGKLYECNGSSCSMYIFAGDIRIALKNSDDVYYYHQDHLGSTRVVTDSRAVVISGSGATQQYPCSNQPVRIAGATPRYFSTLQEAYNAAADGDTIQAQAAIFSENLDLSRSISVTISGGYNCEYSSRIENSELVGMLSDNAGKVTIENFEIVKSGYTKRRMEDVQYLPFGATRSDGGYLSVNHKYTGQELDAETGLYYYNARYYNPVLGRFISPDTIVSDFRNPQALNRYSYVLNNPLRYTDPTGHRAFWRHKFWNGASAWAEVVVGVVGVAFSEVCPACGVVGAALIGHGVDRLGGTSNVDNPPTIDIPFGGPGGGGGGGGGNGSPNSGRIPGPVYSSPSTGTLTQEELDIANRFTNQFLSSLYPIVSENNIETIIDQTAQNLTTLAMEPYNGFKEMIKGLNFGFRAAGIVAWESTKRAFRDAGDAFFSTMAFESLGLSQYASLAVDRPKTWLGIYPIADELKSWSLSIGAQIEHVRDDVYGK